jgi:hypothetical protein
MKLLTAGRLIPRTDRKTTEIAVKFKSLQVITRARVAYAAGKTRSKRERVGDLFDAACDQNVRYSIRCLHSII